MKRLLWEVRPVRIGKRVFGWIIVCEGQRWGSSFRQASAEARARKECNRLWGTGQISELILKGRDNQIRLKDSYGNDNSKVKG